MLTQRHRWGISVCVWGSQAAAVHTLPPDAGGVLMNVKADPTLDSISIIVIMILCSR